MKTIFEKIRDREIPAYFLYESDRVMAFLDISQATKGHTLVVPKFPYKNLFETPSDVIAEIFEVSKKVILKIDETFSPKGYNYLSNQEEIAGQTVFHAHLHIIPRYDASDIDIVFKASELSVLDTYLKLTSK